MIRIGLVFTYNLHYCRGVLRGIKRYAEGRPEWTLLLLGPEAKALKDLRVFRPAGVIAYIFREGLRKALAGLRRPLVNVCGVLPNLDIPRVGVDNVLVGRLAAEHLLERGLRHFAYVGHARHAYSLEREDGFRQALDAMGYSLASNHECGSAPFDPMGHPGALDRHLSRWLSALPKPVGIFACNDPWGIQLAEACRQTRLRVPEDVALVGALNDDLLCELARPPLTSVIAPAEHVGYEGCGGRSWKTSSFAARPRRGGTHQPRSNGWIILMAAPAIAFASSATRRCRASGFPLCSTSRPSYPARCQWS